MSAKFGPDDGQEAARLYVQLGNVEAVAERMGISARAVSRRLHVAGIQPGRDKRKPKAMTPELRAEVVRVFRETGSKRATADALKMGLNRVEDVLAEDLGVL
jgi:transposase-like protein